MNSGQTLVPSYLHIEPQNDWQLFIGGIEDFVAL